MTSTEGMKMDWISVHESLPESLKDVLFTDIKDVFHGYIMHGYIIGETNEPDRWYTLSDFQINNVTHWMPLPNPPK